MWSGSGLPATGLISMPIHSGGLYRLSASGGVCHSPMAGPSWLREIEQVLGPLGLSWLGAVLRLPFDLAEHFRRRRAERHRRENEERRIRMATDEEVARHDPRAARIL